MFGQRPFVSLSQCLLLLLSEASILFYLCSWLGKLARLIFGTDHPLAAAGNGGDETNEEGHHLHLAMRPIIQGVQGVHTSREQ